MKTIAHISDLHFGAEDAAVAEGLMKDLTALSPSLIAISGDLTQRARKHEFVAAKAYLDRLPAPYLVVPGNHDIPLFNLFDRFIDPLDDYHRHITPDLFPLHVDDELAAFGLSTARSFTIKSGRISKAQLEVMQQKLSTVPPTHFKIVVAHHPFVAPPNQLLSLVDIVGRAELALTAIEASGVDLILSGHLHLGYHLGAEVAYPSLRRSVLVAQAGTAISVRQRGEPNSYNFILLDTDTLTITVRQWQGAAFVELLRTAYAKNDMGWTPVPVKQPDSSV